MTVILKRLVLTIFVRLRLLALWRYWNRKSITILALHGIAGRHTSASWTPLWARPTPEQMRKVIGQIGNHYKFISLDHAVRILEGTAPNVDHGLVVTFDDGYRNNLAEALQVAI